MLTISKYVSRDYDVELLNALHELDGKSHIEFGFDFLDVNHAMIDVSPEIISASVEYGAFRDIRRTCRITLRHDGKIKYESTRLRPYATLKTQSQYYKWYLGTFIMSSPQLPTKGTDIITEVACYDYDYILQKGAFAGPYIIEKHTPLISVCNDVLIQAGLKLPRIEPSDISVSRDVAFLPGTPFIEIIRYCLSVLNYEYYIDVLGTVHMQKYETPENKPPILYYLDNDISVFGNEANMEYDTFNIPNRFIVISQNTESENLYSYAEITSPLSQVSTASRGYVHAKLYEYSDIEDQLRLDEMALRIMYQNLNPYEKFSFETPIMPFHFNEHMPAIMIERKQYGIHYKYQETDYSCDLSPGAKMKHKARRATLV